MAGSPPTMRMRVPKEARSGEVVTIKALIAHDMESGYRKDKAGQIIPRRILRRFEAIYEGKTVFAIDLEPFMAANPFIEFRLKIGRSGHLDVLWVEDTGEEFRSSKSFRLIDE